MFVLSCPPVPGLSEDTMIYFDSNESVNLWISFLFSDRPMSDRIYRIGLYFDVFDRSWNIYLVRVLLITEDLISTLVLVSSRCCMKLELLV